MLVTRRFDDLSPETRRAFSERRVLWRHWVEWRGTDGDSWTNYRREKWRAGGVGFMPALPEYMARVASRYCRLYRLSMSATDLDRLLYRLHRKLPVGGAESHHAEAAFTLMFFPRPRVSLRWMPEILGIERVEYAVVGGIPRVCTYGGRAVAIDERPNCPTCEGPGVVPVSKYGKSFCSPRCSSIFRRHRDVVMQKHGRMARQGSLLAATVYYQAKRKTAALKSSDTIKARQRNV